MWTEFFTFVKCYRGTHNCLADVTKVVLRDETKHSSVFEEPYTWPQLVRALQETFEGFFRIQTS